MQTKERVSIQIVEEPKVLLRKRHNKSILGIFVSEAHFCKAVGRHYRVPDEG